MKKKKKEESEETEETENIEETIKFINSIKFIEEEEIKKGHRTIRQEENANKDEYVVKCSLMSALENGFKQNKVDKDSLLKCIQERVECTSKNLQRLSLAINFFIKESCKEKNICDVVLPRFLSDKDITFFRQLMTGNENTKKLDPIVREIFKAFKDLPKSYKERNCPGITNITVRAAEQYMINFRTYLQETFKNHQYKFLKEFIEVNKLEQSINYIRYAINGWTYKGLETDIPEQLLNFIKFNRKILGLDDKNPSVNKLWISRNYEKLILYNYYMSDCLIKNKKKGFLMAPLCKMKSTFIQIDSLVFYGLIKHAKVHNIKNKKMFDDNIEDYWASIIDYQKFITNKNKETHVFTRTIQTDGVSICIHYRRPKTVSKPVTNLYSTKEIDKENVRIIANDPGRVNLFTGVEKLKDGTFKTYKLTRKHYYEKSGITEANKNSEKWNKTIQEQNDELSKCNTKGSLDEFLNYVKVINKHYNIFWNLYLKKKWARQRLKTYSGKKSTLDNFYNSLNNKSGKKIIIAYGDGDFSSTAKYELAAPTTKMFSEAKKHYKVVLVNEYCTSKIDNETKTVLAEVYKEVIKNNEKVLRYVRGLHWCHSTKGSKFVNRDLNACKNILECFMMWPRRPEGLLKDDNNPYKKIKLPERKILKIE